MVIICGVRGVNLTPPSQKKGRKKELGTRKCQKIQKIDESR